MANGVKSLPSSRDVEDLARPVVWRRLWGCEDGPERRRGAPADPPPPRALRRSDSDHAKCEVGSRVSSLDCEIEGIALGTNKAIKYFGQLYYVSRKPAEEIHVFCDCASAVDTVDKMHFITRPDIFTKFNDIRHKLQDLSITVKIVKINSHVGILGNVWFGLSRV